MAQRNFNCGEGFCVEPMSEQRIENAAVQIRNLLYPAGSKFLDVIDLIEHKLPIIFPNFRYEIVRDEELPDREAEFNPVEFCIRVRETVYEKAQNLDGRSRFTLAHELGHFFLHRDQTLAFGHPSENGSIPPYQHSEWQANIFARNLLAPRHLTRGMTAIEVETVFEVSYSVACIITNEIQRKHYTLQPRQMTLGI